MTKPEFYCEHCGAPVPRNASRCASCGRVFDAVKCPSCGFEGNAGLFKDECPSCGYRGTTNGKNGPAGKDVPPSRRKQNHRSYRLIIAGLAAVLVCLLVLLVRSLHE